jgi:hypothetical protein
VTPVGTLYVNAPVDVNDVTVEPGRSADVPVGNVRFPVPTILALFNVAIIIPQNFRPFGTNHI